MDGKQLLASITGTVDQALLLRNARWCVRIASSAAR